MAIDLKAIRAHIKYPAAMHADSDCDDCLENQRALLAEVERLRNQLTLDENFRDPEFGGCVSTEK